jgi:hypothetical protein
VVEVGESCKWGYFRLIWAALQEKVEFGIVAFWISFRREFGEGHDGRLLLRV